MKPSPANSFVLRRSRQRGATLLIVMVCVAITSLMFVALLRLSMAQEDAVATDARQLQACWLVESAVDRAAAQLRAHNDYRGETWNPSAQLLLGPDGAAIETKILEVPDRPELRRIDVQVDYPAAADFRSRQSKSVKITVRGNTS